MQLPQALVHDRDGMVLLDLDNSLRELGFECRAYANLHDIPPLIGLGPIALGILQHGPEVPPLLEGLLRQGTPVILTSSMPGIEPPAGVRFLSKPFLASQLADLVRELVGEARP